MKAWEICKKENVGKVYKDNHGEKWLVYSETFVDTCYELKNSLDEDLSRKYYMSEIAELDFEEVVDWSKVPVDTKILVANFTGIDDKIVWKKRHFAKYENGKIYAWCEGLTSFTASDYDDLYTKWDYVKLYEEEN